LEDPGDAESLATTFANWLKVAYKSEEPTELWAEMDIPLRFRLDDKN